MAWVGVAVYVAAPFQGTGAVIGTILARILGMSWFSTLTATAAGSLVGCVALALLGHYARARVQAIAAHPVALLVALGLTLVILLVMGRWFIGQSSKAMANVGTGDEMGPDHGQEAQGRKGE